jgi:hypothetical protein
MRDDLTTPQLRALVAGTQLCRPECVARNDQSEVILGPLRTALSCHPRSPIPKIATRGRVTADICAFRVGVGLNAWSPSR